MAIKKKKRQDAQNPFFFGFAKKKKTCPQRNIAVG
jgi:hypothetical protein